MSWPLVTLGEIAENCNAKRIPLKQAERLERVGDYDYYGASGVIDKIDDYLFDGDYLLIGEDGNNLISRSSPIAFHARGKFWVNNHAHVLKSNGKADLGFLAYYINSINLEPYVTGSAQPKLNKKNLDSIKIPLPPLEEQKRIAAILDKADSVRRKRQQAIDLADDFLRSVFLDMFGDPVTNPKGWEVKLIQQLCAVTSGSTPSRKNESYFVGNIPWVKTTEVDGYEIFDTEEHISEEAIKETSCKLNPKGSIVLAMYGQGKTRGKVGILGVDAATNQACAVLKPSDKINMLYLYNYLRLSYDRLRALGQGGGQPNLNSGIVKNFEILVPPKEQQEHFVDVVTKVNKLLKSSEVFAGDTISCFNSLSQKAFAGEL